MDSLIYGLILAIVAAIVAYLIGYSKRKGWDDAIGEKIETYNFLFTVMGTIIRSIDEKLYNEMTQVIDKLNAMYESGNVTAQDIRQVIDEAKDVFDRAKQVYSEYKNQGSDS